MEVFLLWHVHEMPDGQDDEKLIGVYASAEDADAARLRVLTQPGFRDLPEGFEVSRYAVGKDHWTEGYVTMTNQDTMRESGETDPPDDKSSALGARNKC